MPPARKMQTRASAWNVRQRCWLERARWNVRSATTPPAVGGCHTTIATDSTATVLRGVVRFRTACDAQRSGFPKRWYGATRPALSHSAAHGAAQCSAAIGATANEHSTQAASCSRQRATGIMQRTTSSTKHPADNTHGRQTREDSVQRTTCSGNDAGDVRRPTACSRHHAAYDTQRTTCSIDAQQTTCSRQRVTDNMLQTTCCRNHGMHDAHQTKWPRRTASMH